jgi:hypothetical protein
VPLVDPNTGLVNKAWYLFFLSLNNVATGVVDNPDIGPTADSLIASYDAALQALAQEVETQPAIPDSSAVLQKQIDDAGVVNLSFALLSQIAEMQKQIDGLQLQPTVTFGTMAFENIGISGTAALAKITAVGTNGSLTFVNGIITAYVAPT